MRKIFLLLCGMAVYVSLLAQCDYAIDSVDEFDSTRLVSYRPINIGYMIPSQVETDKGPMLIEEAKMLFTFTQNDSIDAFFITLAVAEHEYEPISTGFNVKFKLNNDQIFELYNIPDRGTFDPKTNMRIYQHTVLIPLDLFYNLTHHTIQRIRIRYKNKKRDIPVLPEQQEQMREAIRCIGEAIDLFPIKP
jgi:hypothetical protein